MQKDKPNLTGLNTVIMDKKQNRLSFVRQFGKFSMAYSSLQEGVNIFQDASFEGFIPYKTIWGRAYILSNPMTDPRDYEKATLLFLKQFPKTIVCQATAEYTQTLKNTGFFITGFGVENIINLQNFEVSHRVRPNIKRFMTRLKNLGYFVVEGQEKIDILKQISTEWLTLKQNKREFRFLARPFISNLEPDVKHFLLKKDNDIMGFCSFDPVYNCAQDGMVESYVLQHLRLRSSVPKGAADFLLTNALFILKSEDLKKVSLGLSLLHQRSHPIKSPGWIIESFLSMFYHASRLYPCKHIGEHKDRYHADKLDTYLAFSKSFDIIGSLGIMKINGLI